MIEDLVGFLEVVKNFLERFDIFVDAGEVEWAEILMKGVVLEDLNGMGVTSSMLKYEALVIS